MRGVLIRLSFLAFWLGVPTAVLAQGAFVPLQDRYNALLAAGRADEALEQARKLERLAEARFGRNSEAYADAVLREGKALLAQAHYAEAEDRYKTALRLAEGSKGGEHAVSATLNALGVLYQSQARYAEAEDIYRRAIAMAEAFFKGDHPEVASALNNLALVYWSAGRFSDAEPLYKRALAIDENLLGGENRSVAFILHNLANTYLKMGRLADAEETSRRALAIREKALGPDHPEVADTLNSLAVILRNRGRAADALPLVRRALALREKTTRPDHPAVAFVLTALANTHLALNQPKEAEPLAARALAIREKALGPNHPDLASVLKTVAQIDVGLGSLEAAVRSSNRSAGVVISRLAKATPGSLGVELTAVRDYLDSNLAVLSRAASAGLAQVDVAKRAFEVAQWLNQSPAGVALNQMAARFGGGPGALATLVRQQQDASRAYQAATRALLAELSKLTAQRSAAQEARLRRQLGELDRKLEALNGRLGREFPHFSDLVSPKPLSIEDAQRFLGTNEALVFLLVGESQTYLFALTRDSFDWRPLAVSAETLSGMVARFRHGLDLAEFSASIAAGKPEMFDLGLAHDLYLALLKPAEPLIAGKRRLIVVTSGPLTSLPFHALVTEEPSQRRPDLRDLTPYREAAWLTKRHAVTVLPSVTSLRALRMFAARSSDAKPIVGFGDPVFGVSPSRNEPSGTSGPTTAGKTRGYADFWRGAGVARDQLAAALPPLPETADELNAVTASLRGSKQDVHLREQASEAVVKTATLEDFRIVYFATHGLVAGDVSGIGEPSLALTMPEKPSELDDGLLTASEIAELKLNADWVILSACNTAAGDRPGAEALSGLARAFFYAGARALLVSHWAVGSEAATRITTATFELMRLNPGLGRTEALRRAMLAYLEDFPYPAYWAPFSIIGEGAAQ